MPRKLVVLLLSFVIAGCASQSGSHIGAPTESGRSSAPAVAGADGSSFEKAIIIHAADEGSGVKAEYAWIREHIPGGMPAGQALLNHGSKIYDLIHVKLQDGSMRDVYFDITGFFGKL